MGESDLVERCKECDFCIFEHILPPQQRRRSLLDKPFPENHVHRDMVEQVCGRHNDLRCEMKYVVMRSAYDDFMAAQLGAINILEWDLGIKRGLEETSEETSEKDPSANYQEAFIYWTENRDLGRGFPEKYAARFREVWNKGLREDSQTLTVRMMYEIVVSPGDTYNSSIKLLYTLAKESLERNYGTLTI